MKWLCDYVMLWVSTRRRIAARMRALRHRDRLRVEEVAHLRRMFGASVDALDALSWTRRREGAESKYLVSAMQERET